MRGLEGIEWRRRAGWGWEAGMNMDFVDVGGY